MKHIAVMCALCLLAGRAWTADSLIATLRLDAARRGVIQVDVRLVASHKDAEYSCTLPLPREIIPFAGPVFESGVGKYTPNKRQDVSLGPLTTPGFEVAPDALGKAEWSYEVTVGGQVTSPQEGNAEPHYGFVDRDHLVFSTNLVTPLCTAGGTPIPVLVSSSPESGNLRTAAVPMTSDGSILAQGQFATSEIADGSTKVEVRSVTELQPETRKFLAAMLHAMKPLLARRGSAIPNLVLIPGGSGQTYYPLSQREAIVTDLEPLTPERGMRLARVFGSQALTDQLDNGMSVPTEELWLMYALPAYYAVKVAAQEGMISEKQFLYERLENYNLNKATYDALSLMSREPDAGQRDLIAYFLGVPLLYDLDRQLRRSGSSLDAVVQRTHFGSHLWGFRNSLAVSLGPISAYRWWQRQVRSSEPAVDNPDLLGLAQVKSSTHPETKILLTGGVFGHLELCGCKHNQAGGASRRQYFADLTSAPKIDIGNFMAAPMLRSIGDTDRLEADAQMSLMGRMNYSAIALGTNEWPFVEALAKTNLRNRIVSVNSTLFAPYSLISIGGRQMAAVGWSDMPTLQRFESRSWMEIARNPITFDLSRLDAVLASLAARRLPVVLIGEIHPLTIRAVLGRYSNIEMVLSSYTGIGLLTDGWYLGRYVLFCAGDQGATVVTVTGAKGSTGVDHATTVRMSTTLPEDPRTRSWLDKFFTSSIYIRAALSDQSEIKGLLTVNRSAADAIAHSAFVGSDRCRQCHQDETDQWLKTGHATAMKSLIQKHRDHVAACVSCHVVGLNEPSGYSLSSPKLSLQNVGCEVCHGQGLLHTEHPSTANIRRVPPRELCAGCHTAEHSDYPGQPEKYWARVVHNVTASSETQ